MTFTDQLPPELITVFRAAQSIAVLTGAGMSAESGVPTFRDALTGLWAKYDPQELATPQAFQRDPQLVWDWYKWRLDIVRHAQPNAGHYALATMARRVPHVVVITQNVDGLHELAGSTDVIELHGNLYRARCTANDEIIREWDTTSTGLPHCPNCGALLRPDIVWFGEALPPEALSRARRAARSANVFLTVGTSGLVYPAAGLPLEAAESGAVTVQINPERTQLSGSMRFDLRGRAGEVLPELVIAVWPEEA